MPEEKSDTSGFKVVDRRPFSVNGTRREDARREHEEARQKSYDSSGGGPATPRPSAVRSEIEPEASFEPEGSGFETLVSYLSTTAMFQLGLLAGPSGDRIPADLPNARRTIDLLGVLQQKTQGNLTSAEAQLLDEVLYELRMSFIEAERRRGAVKRK